MVQPSLFGSSTEPPPKPASDDAVRMQALITVKAAPTPSESYGETVCVAALRPRLRPADLGTPVPDQLPRPGQDDRFKKYDVVTVDAVPPPGPAPRELEASAAYARTGAAPATVESAATWLDPMVEDSMCRLNRAARATPTPNL